MNAAVVVSEFIVEKMDVKETDYDPEDCCAIWRAVGRHEKIWKKNEAVWEQYNELKVRSSVVFRMCCRVGVESRNEAFFLFFRNGSRNFQECGNACVQKCEEHRDMGERCSRYRDVLFHGIFQQLLEFQGSICVRVPLYKKQGARTRV